MSQVVPPASTTGPEPGLPTVAFQGEPGAFSHEAIRHLLGTAPPTLPRRSFEAVRHAVVSGEAGLGLLPVENTLAGTVVAAYDALARGGVRVCAETIRPIRHFLLGVEGAREEGIRRILSHPVALAQCAHYLESRPEVEAVAVHDTAGAARRVAKEGDSSLAAVAPRGAGDRYGLVSLRADLQDRSDNQTRFYLIRPGETNLGSSEEERSGRGGGDAGQDGDDLPERGVRYDPTERLSLGERTDPWRSVLLFRTDDRPGALVRALEPFARHELNLSKLESRPGGDPWTYKFFVEIDADLRVGRGRTALRACGSHTRELRVLGIFPRPAPSRRGGRSRSTLLEEGVPPRPPSPS